MRIRDASSQGGYVLLVLIGLTLTVIPLGLIAFDVAYAWGVVGLALAMMVSARTFRGRGETDDARPWWRLTTYRRNSVLLGVFLVVQSAAAALGAQASPNPPLVLAGGAVLLVLAALYLHSAIRLR